MKRYYLYLAIFLLFANMASAQVTFIDVAESAGIKDVFWPLINCGDYDNDGYADVIFIFALGSNMGRRLYHNEGDGTFKDVSEIAGAYGSGPNGAVFLDYDNDGYLDIFMSGNIIQKINQLNMVTVCCEITAMGLSLT